MNCSAQRSCRSLCIIDEFGKGTLTADGIGLLCAVLQSFSECRPSPKVIACTHFSEVLNEIYLRRSAVPSLNAVFLLVLDNISYSKQDLCHLLLLINNNKIACREKPYLVNNMLNAS